MQGYNKTELKDDYIKKQQHYIKERIKALKLKATYRPQDGQVIVTYVDDLNRPYFYLNGSWKVS